MAVVVRNAVSYDIGKGLNSSPAVQGWLSREKHFSGTFLQQQGAAEHYLQDTVFLASWHRESVGNYQSVAEDGWFKQTAWNEQDLVPDEERPASCFLLRFHVASASSLLMKQRVVWDKELQETSSWAWFSLLVKTSNNNTTRWKTTMHCDSQTVARRTSILCFNEERPS